MNPVPYNRLLLEDKRKGFYEIAKSDVHTLRQSYFFGLDEPVLEDTPVTAYIDSSFLSQGWQTSALIASIILLQQIEQVSAPSTENFYTYFKLAVESGKFNYPQSSVRLVYPQVDTKPIDVAEEPETKSADKVELETIFNGLAKKWKDETKGQSSVSRIVMHPSYLSIIGLGKEALPLILKDLKNEPNHWFTALRAISKVESSPVRPEDAGNIKKMTEAWLKWGKDNGYLE
jgi:hypothetical protein